LGEFARAEEGYRVAMHADSRHRPAYLNLGILLEQANRLEELEQLVQHARAQDLIGDEIDFIRALLLQRQGRLQDALGLAQGTGTDSISPDLRAQLIGKIAERLDNPDSAFAAFTEMNRAAAADPLAAQFDGTEYRVDVETLSRLTSRQWIESWPQMRLPQQPPAPVFLVGFPRSGTTLLDTILMSHSATHVLEEEAILGQVSEELGGIDRIAEASADQVLALRESYFRRLEAISPLPPGTLVIDKLPLNVLRLPLIHRLFPDAKIVFAQRHPCDVVLSCYMQNFKINRAMASFLDLENAARLYDAVLSYWDQCRDVLPIRTHVVSYENMVADLEGEVRPLLEFLDLPWDDNILDYRRTAEGRDMIRTPSYAQVTEKIYDRARGRWERYRSHMEHVLPILEPWAVRLGYGSLSASSSGNG
jgi:tetratricopeptide (TPR) repeat protein